MFMKSWKYLPIRHVQNSFGHYDIFWSFVFSHHVRCSILVKPSLYYSSIFSSAKFFSFIHSSLTLHSSTDPSGTVWWIPKQVLVTFLLSRLIFPLLLSSSSTYSSDAFLVSNFLYFVQFQSTPPVSHHHQKLFNLLQLFHFIP